MLGAARAALLDTLSFARQAYGDMLMALKPVAYWHLGEAGGTTIVDERAVQHGTYVGPVQFGVEALVLDSPGTSVAFNGSNAYGEIPHHAAFATSEGTLVFAMQPDDVTGQHLLLAKDGVGVAGGLTVDINNGRLRAYLLNAAGSAQWLPDPSGAADIVVDTAYHVALTWGSRGAELWLNGQLVASNPGLQIGLASNTRPLLLAAYPGPVAFGAVVMDELAFFGQQLTGQQIASLSAPRTIAHSVPVQPLTLTALPVFTSAQQRLTTLTGWPAGRTPKQIEAQGQYVHGYLRRTHDYAPNNDGTWIDLVSGWRKTGASPDVIRLRLDDDSMVDLGIEVTHALPGSFKVLDRTGQGSPDFTSWDAAIAGLVAGDTLVVRARSGTWTDPAGHQIPNFVYTSTGTPNSSVNNVTIMAHPDDVAAGRVPVVMRDANSFARFVYAPADAWELHQTLSGEHGTIWRSKQTFTVPQSYCGFYRTPMARLQPGDPDHTWVALFSVRHASQGSKLGVLQDVTYPQTNNWSTSQPYRGPSITWESDGRIYVRLRRPEKRTIMNPSSDAPWPPWDWSAWYAPSEDPRNVPIWIATGPTGSFAGRNRLLGIEGRSGWQVENIAFFFGTCAIYAQSATGTGPAFRGCYFVGGTSGDFNATGQDAVSGLPGAVTYTGLGSLTSDFLFTRCHGFGGSPPWGSWQDGKGSYGCGGMSVRREFTSTASSRAVYKHCSFEGFWQHTWMTTNPWPGVVKTYFQHCLLRNWGSDGALISAGLGDFLISRTRMDLAVPSGISGNGGGTQLATISNSLLYNAAAWVITFSQQQTIHSDLTHDESRDNPMYVPGREIGHGSNNGCLEHIAQSLFIGAHSSFGSNLYGSSTQGSGSSMTPMYIGWSGAGKASRCFNNIGVLVSSPFGWPHGKSVFIAGYRTDGSPLYDHNHVWKVSGSYPAPGGGGLTTALASGTTAATGRADLAALRSATGFETNGTEGTAGFAIGSPAYASSAPTAPGGAFDPANYLLASGSACRTGGSTSLSGHSIKDVDIDTVVTLTGRAWRGPLAPDVPMIEQRLGILGPALWSLVG